MKNWKEKDGWSAWDEYQGKGEELDEDNDDSSAYEITPDTESVCLHVKEERAQ